MVNKEIQEISIIEKHIIKKWQDFVNIIHEDFGKMWLERPMEDIREIENDIERVKPYLIRFFKEKRESAKVREAKRYANELIILLDHKHIKPTYKWVGRVRNDLNEIVTLEEEEIREETIKKKKVYVRLVDDWLTLEEIQKIVKGELPLVYYHGTFLKNFDIVLEEECLSPRKRIEYRRKIKELKSFKEKIGLMKQMRHERKIDIRKFKNIVGLRYKAEKSYDRLVDQIENILKLEIENPLRFSDNVRSLILERCWAKVDVLRDLLRERFELEINNKFLKDIKSKWFLKNKKVWTEIEKVTRVPVFYRKKLGKISEDTFNKFFKLFIEKENLYYLLGIVSEYYPKGGFIPEKVPLYEIRDKWFVFFGAELPYKAKETFETIKKYKEVVFEVKPSIYSRIKWEEIMPGGLEEETPSAIYGKLTHDLITTEKISLRDIIRIYTDKKYGNEIKSKLAAYKFRIPVYIFDQQLTIFQHIMNEMKETLVKYGLE